MLDGHKISNYYLKHMTLKDVFWNFINQFWFYSPRFTSHRSLRDRNAIDNSINPAVKPHNCTVPKLYRKTFSTYLTNLVLTYSKLTHLQGTYTKITITALNDALPDPAYFRILKHHKFIIRPKILPSQQRPLRLVDNLWPAIKRATTGDLHRRCEQLHMCLLGVLRISHRIREKKKISLYGNLYWSRIYEQNFQNSRPTQNSIQSGF